MSSLNLTYWQLIGLCLLPILILAELWLMKNWRRLRDYLNLLYRRSKCISVRYHPTKGGIQERIAVPDAQNVFRLYGGHHVYDARYAEWNARKKLHEVDVFEGVIPSGVSILKRVGNSTYAIPHPQEQEGGFTSVEFDALVRSQIVGAIAAATSREMRQLQTMYYIMFGTLLTVFLSMGLTWYLIDNLQNDLAAYIKVLLNL